jgi:hypothetical protein
MQQGYYPMWIAGISRRWGVQIILMPVVERNVECPPTNWVGKKRMTGMPIAGFIVAGMTIESICKLD